jgi:excinuclease UvrABC nuclease subunit
MALPPNWFVEEFDEDELVQRLVELRESLRQHFRVGRTLQEQLADAIANEKYELAAEIRDEPFVVRGA